MLLAELQRRSGIYIALAALALAGCASIGLDPARNEDTPGEVRSAAKPEPKPFPTVTQSGTWVDVRIDQSCMTRHWRDYDRVTVEERRNDSKGLTWFKAIAGVGLIGGGVPVLVDAHSVGSSSGNTSVYNPVGQGGAYAIGAGLAAVGAVLLGSAIYDVAKANGSKRTPSRVENEETFTGPLACKSSPAHGLVRLMLKSHDGVDEGVDLGALDASGAGRFNLATAIPSGKVAAGSCTTAAHILFVSDGSSSLPKGEYPMDDVDLKPARSALAPSEWAALDKESCRHAKTTRSCDAVKAFGSCYPDSAERAQADALLVEARAALDAAADREAWATATVNQRNCATPQTESDCDAVESYLSRRPDGFQAAEARRILARGKPRVAGLRAAREAREAAAAAAAREAAAAAAAREVAIGFKVTRLRVQQRDPLRSDGRNKYLYVTFDLTVLSPLPRWTTPIVKVACHVGDKRMVDVDTTLDTRLNELSVGDTKELEANPFFNNPLRIPPTSCDILIMKGTGFDTRGPIVQEYCLVADDTHLRDGACPQ
jgi:hypothetical protein